MTDLEHSQMVVKCEYRTNVFVDAMVAGGEVEGNIGSRAFIFRAVQCWFNHVSCSSMFKVPSIRVVMEKRIWTFHWSNDVLVSLRAMLTSIWSILKLKPQFLLIGVPWISWGSHGVPARSCGSPGTPWVAFSFLGPQAHGDMLHSWDLGLLGL